MSKDTPKKLAFAVSDLQQAAKGLHDVEPPAEKKESAKEIEAENTEAIEALERIYVKHNGNLDLIFEELEANPAKAKKPHNRPKDAEEFALKFFQGFYNLVADEEDAAQDKDSK